MVPRTAVICQYCKHNLRAGRPGASSGSVGGNIFRRMGPLNWIPVAVGVMLVIAVIAAIARDSTTDKLIASKTLSEARAGHTTKLLHRERDGTPVDVPPRGVLNLVKYRSPAGEMAAHVSPSPQDGRKHPAIVWLAGGFDNSIGAVFWEEADPEDDQTASAFRMAGIITMYPSYRGGNQNPGVQENLYGEVDDVIAAAEYLRTLPYVDPNRIYLGGHSTGGTLALLAAESTDCFRCIFAFGPVSDTKGYGQDSLVYDVDDRLENTLRSPGPWLRYITRPTFVFEGDDPDSNIGELHRLKRTCKNPLVRFYPVKGVDHFSILSPMTAMVAQKINSDTQPEPDISFGDEISISTRGRQ